MHLVIGLGKTGLSVMRFLRNQQQPFMVYDTRPSVPNLVEIQQHYPNTVVFLQEFPLEELTNVQRIIVSPGISLELPIFEHVRQHNIPVIGDIELFAQYAKAPVIGITGTNAKSTVTTLVGEMIRAAGYYPLVGGNLGTPALDLLLQPEPDFYVLELSSFQLETTYNLQLAVAAILNISPDHLDRHHTMQNYIAAKQRIYQHAQVGVWNSDDLNTKPQYPVAKQLTFTEQQPHTNAEFGLITRDQNSYLAQGNECLMPVSELKIYGKHSQLNALSALAIGRAVDLSSTAMCQTLTTFCGLPHRCQLVSQAHGIHWYNDSKATNVGAAQASIQSLGQAYQPGKLVLIAGGRAKDANFEGLLAPIKQYVKQVILIGEASTILASLLTAHVALTQALDMSNAVRLAAEYAQAGDAVLLAPACASFDMFKDFNERGEVFAREVQALEVV
ncbi:MAG: UDP-N-acetylmuramoyl-L-alanine--D-glutamate ligase [Gammaproteobacteria bacterium]